MPDFYDLVCIVSCGLSKLVRQSVSYSSLQKLARVALPFSSAILFRLIYEIFLCSRNRGLETFSPPSHTPVVFRTTVYNHAEHNQQTEPTVRVCGLLKR